MIIATATHIRLEKAAADNGFDEPRAPVGDWLAFASTQAPLAVWLGSADDGRLVAAFSQVHVARALDEHGGAAAVALPDGAVAARAVADFAALHRMLRRAFQLSRALPTQPLAAFQAEVAGLPRATEVERLVVQRVGQDIFRNALIEYWEGHCAVTGLAVVELLRASHIKPWSHCATDAERLDVFNGLLLAPHLDAAFDAGFLSFTDDGTMLPSPRLSAAICQQLGLPETVRIAKLEPEHHRYLAWHRSKVFRA